MSEKGVLLTSVLIAEERDLSIGELCRASGVSAEYVLTLVEEGLLEPSGRAPPQWRFPETALPLVRCARRLQRDLGVNLPGVALALELLTETRELRARVRALERLLGD